MQFFKYLLNNMIISWSLINHSPFVNKHDHRVQQHYLEQLAQKDQRFDPKVKHFEQLLTFIYLCSSTIPSALPLLDKDGKEVTSHST